MLVQTQIETKLHAAYTPQFAEVLNESHMHSVPPNSETHFKITLACAAFEGVGKVKRHQQIYALLKDEIAGGVHALAMHLYTPDEWQARAQSSPDSPNCLGGSKHDAEKTA